MIAQVAVAHSDPEKVAFARSYSERYPSRTSDEGGAAQVLRDGHSQLIPEIPDELLEAAVQDPEQRELLRTIGMRSAISVPMTAASGTPIGVISFINAESGRVFTEGELELCEELGRRAGIAVENARLYTERSLIAHTLQRALLPPALPEIPGFSLSALYRPGGRGELGRRRLLRRLRGARRLGGGRRRRRRPRRAGGGAHRVRAPRVPHRGAAARRPARRRRLPQPAALRPPGRRRCARSAACTCGRAGRTPRRRSCAAVTRCPTRCARPARPSRSARWGQMLGAWPHGEWSRTTTTLAPGDVLVLYTDGVTDASGAEDRFGDERLQAVLAESSDAEDALRRLADGLADFETGEQADDTAALAIARSVPGGGARRSARLGRVIPHPLRPERVGDQLRVAPPHRRVALLRARERARDAAEQHLQVRRLGVGAHRRPGRSRGPSARAARP